MRLGQTNAANCVFACASADCHKGVAISGGKDSTQTTNRRHAAAASRFRSLRASSFVMSKGSLRPPAFAYSNSVALSALIAWMEMVKVVQDATHDFGGSG